MLPVRKYSIITYVFIIVFSSSPLLAQEDAVNELLYIDTNAPCISSKCHSQMNLKKYVHQIGVDPKKCNRCHEIIQEGEHRFSPISEKTVTLCARCHDKNAKTLLDIIKTPPRLLLEGEGINWHKPFAEGKCTICHDAHESDYFMHLKKAYPEGPYASFSGDTYSLCINNQCHQNFGQSLELPRVLTGTFFRNGNLNLHYKHVKKKKGRTCRTCHRHHGSEYPDLLTDSFKFGTRVLTLEYKQTDTGGSCKTPCHREGKYDRYEPIFNPINSSPTPGEDATQEELNQSKKKDMQDKAPQN